MAATGPNNSPQTTKESTPTAAEMVKEPTAAAAKNTEEATKTQQDDTTKINPSNATTVTPAAAPSTSKNTPPNYFSTKSSKAYTLAYKLLNSDNFQDALSTLETALKFTVQILRADHDKTANAKKGDEEEEDCMELHESLAPLYYLYGSTLLYSVEESDVMMAGSGQQQQQPTGGAPHDNSPPPDFEVDNQQQQQEEPEMMSTNPTFGEYEQPPQEAPSDPTEDLQIAWENLETARSIVTKLAESFHPLGDIIGGGKSEYSSSTKTDGAYEYTTKEQSDLLLDLAQIHTRLGDLQRGNNSVANTSDCISDYTTALKLRRKVLGRYHKKVADSHYSLAGVYAEAPSKGGEEMEDAVDRFVSQLDDGRGGGEGGGKGGMTESEKVEYREKSLENFVECAVSFSGMLAGMCGEDADVLTDLSNSKSTASAAASASAASTNDNGGGIHSTMLSTLRTRVSNLTPPTKSPEKETFEDIQEMLDEIQEAVDTAEEAEEGLKTLGEMKANEIRKHEAKMNGEQGEEEEVDGGGMTTIGFGASAAAASGNVNVFGAASSTAAASAAAASSSTSVNAFGSASAETSAAAQPMMMVVKKKKKKVQPVLLDADSAKRAKTE